MSKLFYVLNIFFSLISYSENRWLNSDKNLSSNGDKHLGTINTPLCVECVLPKSLKSCNFAFKWRANNSCMNIRLLNYTHLWLCCTCHNEHTFSRHRDENINTPCLQIFKRFHVNTKYVMEWNTEKRYSLQNVPSTNNKRITKTSSHIGRKLLMQTNGDESNSTRLYSSVRYSQQGHFKWEDGIENVILQCLILLVMMFIFFAIIIAMTWLCSLYVLNRLTKQNDASHNNMCLDVTEF